MNFLQIVQAVKREGGISGTSIATLVNPVEEIARLVSWVQAAYLDIQTMHDKWNFLRTSFSFNTVTSQQTYTPVQAGVVLSATPTVSNLAKWKPDSLRRYQVSVGANAETFLPPMDYDKFRNTYLFGAMRTISSQPVVYTVDTSKNLVLGPIPNGAYTINGECWVKPYEMTVDADEPVFPSQFHTILVWKALAHYGMFEAASEAVQKGEREYKNLIAKLEDDQLPRMDWGEALL
jgi:hypothetical protein